MVRVKIRLDRIDKERQLIERREQISRSLLLNFIGMLYVLVSSNSYTLRNIYNALVPLHTNAGFSATATHTNNGMFAMSAAPGNNHIHYIATHTSSLHSQYYNPENNRPGHEVGIVVGTGGAAVILLDYALDTQIPHGDGMGEFLYGGCEVLPPVVADPDAEFSIRRYFTNASGGLITVNEAGIYAIGAQATAVSSGEAHPMCIARDLVAPGVDVADTEILAVTYTIEVMV